MDTILQQPIWRNLMLIAIFVLTVASIYFAVTFAVQRSGIRQQLLRIAGSGKPAAGGGAPGRALGHNTASAWSRIVRMVESSGLNLTDSKPDIMRQKLAAAGFESPIAPQVYSLIRLVLIFVFPGILIAYMVASGAELTIFRLYVLGSGCAILGLVLPAWIVRILSDRRKEAITNGFPNCLDLMLVCVESGLGMEAAIDRVGREMAEADPIVSELLVRTTLHMRAGASREEAFHRLSDMARVDEIRSFCTLLIQSDKLGTSISTTLRVFASEMRERRRMRAEEKAHRLPVLISIPLITCMLPTMVGVLMLPAAIRVIRQLLPAMGG